MKRPSEKIRDQKCQRADELQTGASEIGGKEPGLGGRWETVTRADAR